MSSFGSTGRSGHEGARSMRQKLRRKQAGLCAAVLATILPVAAQSADLLKPPASFRHWFFVNTMIVDKTSPLFDAIGGLHNVYVNKTGEASLKKGGLYPNGTIFLVDHHKFSVEAGTTTEGARDIIAMMVKDKKKYAATGGWGFQAWADGDVKKPLTKDPAKDCFACHQSQKDHDLVFSTYLP